MQDQALVTKDAPKITYVPLEDGNQIIIDRKMPYGHFHMVLERGELPEKYTGVYTTFNAVQVDANKYAQERKLAILEVAPKKKK